MFRKEREMEGEMGAFGGMGKKGGKRKEGRMERGREKGREGGKSAMESEKEIGTSCFVFFFSLLSFFLLLYSWK